MNNNSNTEYLLEIHYYFNDGSHSMDAFIKNECDKAILNIIKQISERLGSLENLQLEVIPCLEGGLIQRLKLIVSIDRTIAVAALVIPLFTNQLPPSTNIEAMENFSQLSIEEKELEVKKKQLEVEILTEKLEQIKVQSNLSSYEEENPTTNTVNPDEQFLKISTSTPELIDTLSDKRHLSENAKLIRQNKIATNRIEKLNIELAVVNLATSPSEQKIDSAISDIYSVLIDDKKIRKNISNFYSSLNEYEKLEKVSFSAHNTDNPLKNEITINRTQFKHFILQTACPIEQTDNFAEIQLISIDLSHKNKKWKGYYERDGKIINFTVEDPDFKNKIKNGNITLNEVPVIRARLQTRINIDNAGFEKSRDYIVDKVWV